MTFNTIDALTISLANNSDQFNSDSEDSQHSLGSHAESIGNQFHSASFSDNMALLNDSDNILERCIFLKEQLDCVRLHHSVLDEITVSMKREFELFSRMGNLRSNEDLPERRELISSAIAQIKEINSYFKQVREITNNDLKKEYSYSYENGVEINFASIKALLEEARSTINTIINPKLDLLEQTINQTL